jgi:hypothetical protein
MALAHKQICDFDPLLFAHEKRMHAHGRIEREPVFFGKLRHVVQDIAAVEEKAPSWLSTTFSATVMDSTSVKC